MLNNIFRALVVSFVLCTASMYATGQQIEYKEALALVANNASRLNISATDVEQSIVSNAFFDQASKTVLVYLQQSYLGIPVYNQIQVLAFKNEKVVSTSGGRLFGMDVMTKMKRLDLTVSPEEAFRKAALSVQLTALASSGVKLSEAERKSKYDIEYKAPSLLRENVKSELVWFPTSEGKVVLAWQVRIVPKNTSDYWLIMVNAQNASIEDKVNLTVSCNWEKPAHPLPTAMLAGRILQNRNDQPRQMFAVNSANYRVIPFPAESMNHTGGVPVIVHNPWENAGAGNPATTLNWHNDGTAEYAYSRGNNVWAREDTLGDNSVGASVASTSPLPDLNFDFAFNGNEQPTDGDNQKFAITNLFYWNNIMHDVSYQYGFDEPAGNFQRNNLARGGLQNDAVVAEAQDGSSLNNANFAVGADGNAPRMQMYLWEANPYIKAHINSPSTLQGYVASVESALSDNNKLINTGPITADLVLYNDDAAATLHLACTPPVNAAALAGKIALIDRGSCDFVAKIKNAQNAGAVAVLVINNVADELSIMSGSDNSITIPALMIFQSDGAVLKSVLATTPIQLTLKSQYDLDGDFDNGIIAHEYTHGISNRLTGGAASPACLQNNEQMGEGWSDYFALMVTTDWSTATVADGSKPRPLGTYAYGEDPVLGGGIRTYPYSTDLAIDPWTYADLSAVTNGEEHTIGEVWASVLWDMTWNMIAMDGINTDIYKANAAGGNSASLKLVTLAMKLQPCSPGFLDGRDALLKADEILYKGKYRCAIWSAFTRRGMGTLARQGSAANSTDQVADFTLPAGATIHKSVDKVETPQFGELNYTFTIQAQCAGITNYKVVDTLQSNVTYISGGVYNAGNRTVTFNVPDLPPMGSAVFNLKVRVNNGSYFIPVTQLSETVNGNFVPLTLASTSDNAAVKWSGSTTNHSAPYSVKSASTSLATEQILTSLIPYTITGHTQLSFWHMYNTQPGKDGGVVELSGDGGNTWFDARPYIAMNGYNTTINTVSSLSAKQAYSGISGGFINTVINLSAFQNQAMMFRFRYVTDNAGSSTGWYIDDITLRRLPGAYNVAAVVNNTGVIAGLSDTVTAISSVVLPLSWGEFTAEKEGSTAILNWSTLQEINADEFVIERSNDGTHFSVIGKLSAMSNTTQSTAYHFTDKTPATGLNVYRILQTDKDGRSAYSPVRSLNFEEPASAVIIAPNPFWQDITVRVTGNNTPVTIKLMNSTGQLIKSLVLKKEVISINANNLPAGVYYIQVTGGNINTMKKVVRKK